MAVLKNRAGVSTATIGTGIITLGSALAAGVAPNAAAWQTFAAAGVADGNQVRYLILDNNGAWEYGVGTYTASGTTLSRASGAMDGSVAGQRSSTGSLLSLSGSAQVFIAAVAEDLVAAISDTPPASPVSGQLWWQSSTGILWLYYTDIDSSQWIAISSVPGAAPASGVVQHVYAENTSALTTTLTMGATQFAIPTNTQGLEILTATITPTNANSKLRIEIIAPIGTSTNAWTNIALFRDNVVNAIANSLFVISAGWASSVPLTIEVPAGSTAQTTFHVRFGPNVASGGTAYLNSAPSGAPGASRATIAVTELAS